MFLLILVVVIVIGGGGIEPDDDIGGWACIPVVDIVPNCSRCCSLYNQRKRQFQWHDGPRTFRYY